MTKKLNEIKVGVLLGGLSNEREVSLATGAAILSSLERSSVSAVGIDAGRDLCARIAEEKIDVAFIALHGRYGEDGCVQGALEVMGVAYTGSGVTASSVAMDKALTKTIAESVGVRSPKSQIVDLTTFEKNGVPEEIKAPVVVKPAAGGSSIGVSICQKDEQVHPALVKALEVSDVAMIETFIEGPLVTIGIVDGKPLPPIEIEPLDGFYDYERKYTPGKTLYHIPARISGDTADEAARMVVSIHKALGCRGVTRSEVIVDASGLPWFIELNTIPGMTETSLLPKAAKAYGLSFDDLTMTILKEALR